MADGQEIHAQTPDGPVHVFPAGTPDVVVDPPVKSYLQSQAPLRTGRGREEATRPNPTLPGNQPKLPEPKAEAPSAIASGGYGIPDLSPGRKVATMPQEEAKRQGEQ